MRATTLLFVFMLGCSPPSGGEDAGSDAGTDGGSLNPPAPTISSFTASPANIRVGQTSTLHWTVRGGALTVNGAAVSGTSLEVTPTTTTGYTITATSATGSASATTTVSVMVTSVPSNPIAFTRETVFTTNSGTTNWVYIPASYDETHQTPTTLFVWLHGCGGFSQYDIYSVSPGGAGQSWISLAVGGQEGNCWDMSGDPVRVLAAISELKTHFNVAPKHVILGGYSSGGDLTYRTAFYNAEQFAGVVVENTSPFRDTGSSMASSLAAASWKLNVVHLAHHQDAVYPLAGVEAETDALTAAGFPMTRIEADGDHYDAAGTMVNGHAVPGTSADVVTYLFPYLSAGWSAP